MRRLIVTTFLTLDGVMQAPGGPGEDDSGGFTHGGWSVNYWDDLMGQIMGDAWQAIRPRPRAPDVRHLRGVLAERLRGGRRQAAQRRHQVRRIAREAGARLGAGGPVEGDAAQAIAALKQADGPELQVHGSGNLIQTLLRHDLVDEFHLWVFPVVLGTGKRLFADGAVPGGLKLVDTKVSTTGVVIGTYSPRASSCTGTVGG